MRYALYIAVSSEGCSCGRNKTRTRLLLSVEDVELIKREMTRRVFFYITLKYSLDSGSTT